MGRKFFFFFLTLILFLADISSVDIVEIDEPCAHEIQYGGLCAECGKDMTECVYSDILLFGVLC